MRTEAARLYHRQWYLKNKLRKLAQNKAWRDNPDNRQKQRDYTAKHTKKNHAKKLEYSRKYHKENELVESMNQSLQCLMNPERKRNTWLKSRYGITQDQYKDMLAGQGGRCPICLITQEEHIKIFKRFLYVDHCHQKGKVRGILCDQCNNGLGRFKDNIEFLKRAIDYLQRTSQ